jgi:hypothetical protein
MCILLGGVRIGMVIRPAHMIADTLKMQNKIFVASKNSKTWHDSRWFKMEQIFFLGQLPNLSGFWIIKFRTNPIWILFEF